MVLHLIRAMLTNCKIQEWSGWGWILCMIVMCMLFYLCVRFIERQLIVDARTCNLHPFGREIALKPIMMGSLVFMKGMEWSTYLKTICSGDRVNQDQQMIKITIPLYFSLGVMDQSDLQSNWVKNGILRRL